MWLRFQNDIFSVWNHGPETLNGFHQYLNMINPKISLILHYGHEVSFLDPSIAIIQNRLEYSVYTKDTVTHSILPRSSHHTSHTSRGILFGEFLRFSSYSSTRESFKNDDDAHPVFLWIFQKHDSAMQSGNPKPHVMFKMQFSSQYRVYSSKSAHSTSHSMKGDTEEAA